MDNRILELNEERINKNKSIFIIINFYNKILIISFLLLALLLFKFYKIQLNKKIRKIKKLNYLKLINEQNQSLQLFVPSNICHFPRTLYFNSIFRPNNYTENININISYLNLNDNNYFVTYYLKDSIYLNYLKILKNHRLIKSGYKYKNNNLFLHCFNETQLIKMQKTVGINKYQKIKYYINIREFFYKDSLYKNYIKMKNLFKDEYNYMAETFYYPEDKDLIEQNFKDYNFDLNDIWLVKPKNGSCGEGIFIFKTLKEINLDNYLLTKYIKNINLINNKKYDLRLYVLITGLKPLRIYFYNDGLVRLASRNYTLNPKNIRNKYIHLTNVAINKHNIHFKMPKNYDDENASLLNLNSYKKYLYKHNVNYTDIFNQIKDLIIKSIISLQDKIINKNEELNLDDRNFFHLFGFDVLITEDYKPILLEINTSPSMNFFGILEKVLKTNLIVDTLNIIGIIPFSHEKEFNSFDPEYKFKNNIEELINYSICELSRPRGNYELIFPTKENINIYKKFFINNVEENNKFWETLLENNH